MVLQFGTQIEQFKNCVFLEFNSNTPTNKNFLFVIYNFNKYTNKSALHVFVYNNFKHTCFADFQYDKYPPALIIGTVNLTILHTIFHILPKIEQ